MKKINYTVFVISMITCFLFTCTLPPANAESEDNGLRQENVNKISEQSTLEQSTPEVATNKALTQEQLPESQPFIAKANIDSVEISVDQIIEKAEQGDIYSQYDLALMYFEGQGVPQNIDQASTWLLEAAKRGHLKSQQYLATLYESGKKGFAKDKEKAEYWLSLRGRPASSSTEQHELDNGSEKGISFSGFTVFSVCIVFALIAIAFFINKKKIKPSDTNASETITLDSLEDQDDSDSESDITLDDLSAS